ncbi:MAG TPA: FMN-binding negative transcriptional regulator [Gemmataceae bacterium]|nr:FMN-binding negative transcriptional regulator [Gemmataceae bacterium]
MFTPAHFEESRLEILHDLMRRHALAMVVTLNREGQIVANHVPLLLCASPAPLGTLQGHVARANPLWSDSRQDVESLAVFQGPESYISPSWYATKKETGRVVPTWNYAVVHAYGFLRIMDDANWVKSLVERLTAVHESSLPQPWSASDAPADYIESRLEAIVGIEMVITRLQGKWKMSQNQPGANRAGVIDGLRSLGTPLAAEVADQIRSPPSS